MTATKLLQVIMPLFLIIVPAGLSYFLAKDKGRNIGLWTALGLIPFLNLVFLLFFLSATNLRLEAKLDRIITSLDTQK